MKKLRIEQKDGYVKVYENDELQVSYNFTKHERRSDIALANMIAELLYDTVNCKDVRVTNLYVCNDTRSYMGTYLSHYK